MEPQQSTQIPNDQIAELGQRMARMETRMEFVATHKDLAAVRTEIAATHKDIAAVRTDVEGTRTEIASLKGELLSEMAQMNTAMVAEVASVKTLVANREASMQRWLLGITATTVVGVSTAMAGVAAALIQAFG